MLSQNINGFKGLVSVVPQTGNSRLQEMKEGDHNGGLRETNKRMIHCKRCINMKGKAASVDSEGTTTENNSVGARHPDAREDRS